MTSIKLKQVIICLALVFIVMLISGTFMITRINLQEIDKAHTRLMEFARYINEQVIEVYSPEAFQEAFSNEVALKSGQDRIQGNILNANGQTIASNVTSDVRILKYINTAIISALAGEQTFSQGKDLDFTGQYKELISYAEPVFDADGQVKYVIFTRLDAENILKNLADLAITLVFTLVLSLTLTAILGFLFANTLTEPIIILTKKAKEMAQGKLNQTIPVNSPDEIGQLTQSFNNMAKELNETIHSMASEKNKMEILLHNMTDGVLAYDKNGSLIHANSLCTELLELDEIEQLPFSQMMEILGVDTNILQESLSGTNITTKQRFIHASFTPYLNKSGEIDGIVIVLQDVTQHKKLDNMRKEFVANVSHEIRTPISIIKTYAETLIDGAIEQKDLAIGFLNIIDSEADRMTLLVKDLLELSQLDNSQIKLSYSQTDIIEVINEVVRQVSVMATKKNQQLIIKVADAKFIADVDPARLNQALINVIGNAIKYSDENSVIEVSAEESEKLYRIIIKDSGIGIPKKDLPHIFERFYRVDKARSRAMGGTGLGLAIAKEIIEAHNGTITASSVVGEGTTMVISIPKL